jgi:hypothetical protein
MAGCIQSSLFLMPIPAVRLKIRVRLSNGSCAYIDPVLASNGSCFAFGSVAEVFGDDGFGEVGLACGLDGIWD